MCMCVFMCVSEIKKDLKSFKKLGILVWYIFECKAALNATLPGKCWCVASSLFIFLLEVRLTCFFSSTEKKKYFWGQQIQLTFKKKSVIQKIEAKEPSGELMDAHKQCTVSAVN